MHRAELGPAQTEVAAEVGGAVEASSDGADEMPNELREWRPDDLAVRPTKEMPCSWKDRVYHLFSAASALFSRHFAPTAPKGPAFCFVLVCTHETFAIGKSIFSHSTEIGPAFP